MGRICQARKKKGGKVDDGIKMDGWMGAAGIGRQLITNASVIIMMMVIIIKQNISQVVKVQKMVGVHITIKE